MPDHVHLVLTPFIDEAKREIVPLSKIMKAIKSASAFDQSEFWGQRHNLARRVI